MASCRTDVIRTIENTHHRESVPTGCQSGSSSSVKRATSLRAPGGEAPRSHVIHELSGHPDHGVVPVAEAGARDHTGGHTNRGRSVSAEGALYSAPTDSIRRRLQRLPLVSTGPKMLDPERLARADVRAWAPLPSLIPSTGLRKRAPWHESATLENEALLRALTQRRFRSRGWDCRSSTDRDNPRSESRLGRPRYARHRV